MQCVPVGPVCGFFGGMQCVPVGPVFVFVFGGVQCVPVGPVCDFFGGVQCVPVGHPLDQIKPNRFGATHKVWFPVCFGFTFFFF